VTVELDAVTIRYGSLTAVDGATASFPAGSVGLLGRNGAGKSSILKAILGLLRPDAGRIQILDLPSDADPREIRRRVGYMPEKDAYVPGLNGFETVALAGRLTGMPALVAAQRAHEVLYLVGIEEQRYRPVAGYSTGMRQKVKLATALVHDPDLLFLDEPTNGLDPKGRQEMLEIVRALAVDLGKSVVLSSHILGDVEFACSSVVLMERGRVLASGPLQELTRTRTRTIELDVAGDRGAVQVALRNAGVSEVDATAAAAPEAAVPGGPHRLRLAVDATMARSAVFAAVLDAGATVLRLVEHRRSLEEVFLGAVGDDVAARRSAEESAW
jgi:ABC-2 type transport system ATP-binding protein